MTQRKKKCLDGLRKHLSVSYLCLRTKLTTRNFVLNIDQLRRQRKLRAGLGLRQKDCVYHSAEWKIKERHFFSKADPIRGTHTIKHLIVLWVVLARRSVDRSRSLYGGVDCFVYTTFDSLSFFFSLVFFFLLCSLPWRPCCLTYVV